MKLRYNGKIQELKNICINVDSFINILDQKLEIKKNINFNNATIYNKTIDFFEYCLNTPGTINFEKFLKEITKFYGFKFGFKRSIKSFIERGFSEKEAKMIMHSFREKYIEKQKNNKENLFNQNKKYSFGKIRYHSDNEPVCNLCGGKLVFQLLSNGVKKIIGCSNEKCDGYTNKPSSNIKIKGMVPIELYENAVNYRKEHSVLNIQYWINKGFSEKEANKKIVEIQKHRSSFLDSSKRHTISKKDAIEKFGKDGAEKFFKERSQLCIEYWTKRGYDELEAKEKISKLQSENSKHVKKYGVAKTIQYWINKGFSEEEAKQKLSESQKTFSKEICIQKYGEIEGLKRWEERQNKWQKSLHESDKLHVGYSNVSQELFNILTEKLQNKDYIFYGSKNHEYCIRENNTNYIYDFTDLENRKIIEFQGDIYHGNPELFGENEHPNPFYKEKSCKDIWEFDQKKSDIAIKHNFEILHVWEKDYRNNKNVVINKCLNFLKNE